MKTHLLLSDKYSGMLKFVQVENRVEFERRMIDLFGTLLHQSLDSFKDQLKQELRENEIVLSNGPLMEVREIVSKFYACPISELMSKSRIDNTNKARQVAMWISKYLKNAYSMNTIGSFYNRDHATVINGVKKVEGLYQVDRNFRIEIRDLLILCEENGIDIKEHLYILTNIKVIK
jgi:chromosomal replication initiation ATPase DnaA